MKIKSQMIISVFAVSFVPSQSMAMDVFSWSEEEKKSHSLITSGGHDCKFTTGDMEELIEKGDLVLKNLLSQSSPIEHTLDILENYQEFDDGRRKLPFKSYMDPNTPPTHEFLNQSQDQGWLGTSILSSATSLIPTALTSMMPAMGWGGYWTPSSEDVVSEESFSSESTSSESTKEPTKEEGWELLGATLQTQVPPFFSSSQRRAYLESIVSIVWRLYDIAYEGGQNFVRGAFILEDKDHKIHDLFENYCYEASQTSKEQKLLTPGSYGSSNFAYNRDGKFNSWFRVMVSSHFTRPGARLTHYGLDMRFEKNAFCKPVLPHQKEHLLWGASITQTGQRVTFIKPEEYGLGGVREQKDHLFVYGGGKPDTNNCRREKDIPEDIAKIAYALIKELAQSKMVTNVIFVPENLFLTLKGIVDKVGSYQAYHFKNSTLMDISFMTYLINTLKEHPHTSLLLKERADELWKALTSHYDEKSLHLRTGNEVILMDSDLLRSH